MTDAADNSKVFTAEALPSVPARELVFVMTYSFADLAKVYAQVPSIMNAVVLERCDEDKLRIRVSEREVSAEAVRLQFKGDLEFRLDVDQKLFGARFLAPVRTPAAIALVNAFGERVLGLFSEHGALPIQNVEAMTFDIQHKFWLADPERKNKHVVNDKLVPGLASGKGLFSSFLTSVAALGRTDLKFSVASEGDRHFFITVECPGNEEYSTIWPTFNLRTGEDRLPREVEDLGAYFSQFMDHAQNSLNGQYAQFLEALLLNEQIDLSRRVS